MIASGPGSPAGSVSVTAPSASPAVHSEIREREAEQHGVGETARDRAHTNGVECAWCLLTRGYRGTFHHIFRKNTGELSRPMAKSVAAIVLAPHACVMPLGRIGARIASIPAKDVVSSDLVVGEQWKRFQVRRQMDIA